MLYVVLTADLVASRRLGDRAAAQERLEAAIATANRRFRDALVVPLAITVGDEWQGLCRGLADAVEIDFFVREELAPLVVAAGIGRGEIATPLRERTAEMDGPSFHRARAALEQAKRHRGPATVVDSGDERIDLAANAVYELLHAVAATWTERQRETIRAYEAAGTETAAAERLGVRQPTVNETLARALAKPWLSARANLVAFLRAMEDHGKTA